jgi:hypothetical protein
MDDQFIAKDSNGASVSTTAADGAKTFSLNWRNWDLNSTSDLISAILVKGEDYDVTQFMTIPWTPPNHSVSRWKLPSDGTTLDYENTPELGGYLDPTHCADYADLLAEYVLGYQAKMGVELDVLSLQNEPNWRCNDESANWTAAQIHDFFTILKAEFAPQRAILRCFLISSS